MSERIVVLDTETTGFNPAEGHRLVEIGCVEMINMRKTGEIYHQYINPEREIPQQAIAVHGITNEKVAQCPRFSAIARSFLDFVGDDPLVIHNAAFDMGFLNYQLRKEGFRPLADERAIDTLLLARRKFPGTSASLDALCKRFDIDNTHRTHHGALLDAELLAEVYIELTGGNQFRLDLPEGEEEGRAAARLLPAGGGRIVVPTRTWAIPEEDEEAHRHFLERILKEAGACLWLEEAH